MKNKFKKLFGDKKPIIAMVHLPALPGAPLYDAESGMEGIVESAWQDLKALQAADVDAVMFGNENDRPYELKVDSAATASMAYVVGKLKAEIEKPFGVNVLWDPMSTVALAVATGASFMREILTGTYVSDMGIWNPNAGAAMRYRNRLGGSRIAMFDNICAEFADSLDKRPLPIRARSAVFSSIPDAILVSGGITGEAAKMSDLASVKEALPEIPVLANTGVRHDTVVDVLKIADGCIVGSSFKVDGNTWNAVDAERAKAFMEIVKSHRGS